MSRKDPQERNAYRRQYYAANRDRLNASKRLQRAANPEPYRARDRQLREKYRAQKAAYRRDYYRRLYFVSRMEAIERLGGCCIRCGYKADLRALQIDHIDPTTRAFHVSRTGNYSFRNGFTPAALQELGKCQLLCANCHAIKTCVDRQARYAA